MYPPCETPTPHSPPHQNTATTRAGRLVTMGLSSLIKRHAPGAHSATNGAATLAAKAGEPPVNDIDGKVR